MARPSERILSWLWTVLQAHRYPRLAHADVASVLSTYPNLKAKTAVYSYEDGHSALLLCLSGNLSVRFRQAVYQYPVELWVPEDYGECGHGVLCYVVPTASTGQANEQVVVRPGQHVAGDGRVYHPYLHAWNAGAERSSIAVFLAILQDLFAREPPLVARQLSRSLSPRSQQALAKPPLPPKANAQISSQAPRLPPKPGESADPWAGSVRNTYTDGPPPPPLPNEVSRGSHMATSDSIIGSRIPYRQGQSEQQHGHDQYRLQDVDARQHDTSIVARPAPRPNATMVPLRQGPLADPALHSSNYQPSNTLYSPPGLGRRPNVAASVETPDLLSDTVESSLASPLTVGTNVAPPLPPNPERENLLAMLSSSMIALIYDKVQQRQSALVPLRAQQIALQQAVARLDNEKAQLESLDAVLTTNETILRKSLGDCDAVIAASRSLAVPNTDDLLVAPTVVSQQLWNICADEVAIREALWCLQGAISAGRISSVDFIKTTRGLAREAFFKMALGRKIASGMGLNLGI